MADLGFYVKVGTLEASHGLASSTRSKGGPRACHTRKVAVSPSATVGGDLVKRRWGEAVNF